MKKQLFSAILMALALGACSKEKDAEYYFNHPDELRVVMDECDKKTAVFTMRYQELLRTEIDSEEDLSNLRKQVEKTISEVEAVKKDATCNNAAVAMIGVRLDNLKEAQLAHAEAFAEIGDEVIQSFQNLLKRAEAGYEARKIRREHGQKTMDSYFKKDESKKELKASDLFN